MFGSTSQDQRSFTARLTRLALLLCATGALSLIVGCVTQGAGATARNARGVEYFSAGQYDKAIALFQDAIAENPESAESYYNLGSAYQRKANATGDRNLLTQAENAYWTALQLNPAPETIVCCYRGIATSATARGDSESAMRVLEEWRDRNPDSVEPRLEIAYLLEAQEQDDASYEMLQQITQDVPNDYRAYYKMGILSERAGDLDDALERTNVALKLNPSNDEVVQRARQLESQYAARQRESKREGETSPSVANETIVAESSTLQTTRVPSTSAQAEQDQAPPPEMILPDEPTIESAPIPQSNDPAQGVPAASTNALGFSEVVVIDRANASDALQTQSVAVANKNDSDVQWIASTSAKGTVAQTSGTTPKGVETPSGSNVASNANQTNVASTVHTARPSRAKKQEKNAKRRPGLNGGMPSVRAGDVF